MRVFVAGASGAIGQPLIAELVRRGHTVTGMTRSEAGARRLRDLGASVAQISAFDAPSVHGSQAGLARGVNRGHAGQIHAKDWSSLAGQGGLPAIL